MAAGSPQRPHAPHEVCKLVVRDLLRVGHDDEVVDHAVERGIVDDARAGDARRTAELRLRSGGPHVHATCPRKSSRPRAEPVSVILDDGDSPLHLDAHPTADPQVHRGDD